MYATHPRLPWIVRVWFVPAIRLGPGLRPGVTPRR